jgi:hypothetical protein
MRLLLLLPLALLFQDCGVGHGLDPGPPDGMGIKGTITFVGKWPENTGDLAVAVYRKRPQKLADFFTIAAWDTSVAIGVARYEYFVRIEDPGDYEWIVIAWQKKGGFWDVTSLLGCHHEAGADLPTPVRVESGKTTKGIDITADFGLLSGENLPERRICMGFLPPLPGFPGLLGDRDGDR